MSIVAHFKSYNLRSVNFPNSTELTVDTFGCEIICATARMNKLEKDNIKSVPRQFYKTQVRHSIRFLTILPLVTLFTFNVINLYLSTYTFTLPPIEVVNFLDTSTSDNTILVNVMKDIYNRCEEDYVEDIENMGIVVLPKLVWSPTYMELLFMEELFNFTNYSDVIPTIPSIKTLIIYIHFNSLWTYVFNFEPPKSGKSMGMTRFLNQYIRTLYKFTNALEPSYNLQSFIEVFYAIKVVNFIVLVSSVCTVFPCIAYSFVGDYHESLLKWNTIAFGILGMVVLLSSLINLINTVVAATFGPERSNFISMSIIYLGQIICYSALIWMLIPVVRQRFKVAKEKALMATFLPSPEVTFTSFYDSLRGEGKRTDIKLASDSSTYSSKQIFSSQSLDPMLRPKMPYYAREESNGLRIRSSVVPGFKETTAFPVRCATAPVNKREFLLSSLPNQPIAEISPQESLNLISLGSTQESPPMVSSPPESQPRAFPSPAMVRVTSFGKYTTGRSAKLEYVSSGSENQSDEIPKSVESEKNVPDPKCQQRQIE